MQKLSIFLFLIFFASTVKANTYFGFNQLYYFNVKSNSTSSIEKLFTTDAAILQKPDKAIVQHFEGWLQLTELSAANRSKLYAATIYIKQYKLWDEYKELLQLPFAQQQLETTFYFDQLHNNLITNFYFNKDIETGAQKILKELLAHFQYAIYWPNKLKWTAVETSTNGACSMQYNLLAKNTAITTIQKKPIYLKSSAASSNKNTIATHYNPYGNIRYSYSNATTNLKYVSGQYNITTTVGTKRAGTLRQKIYIADTTNENIMLPTGQSLLIIYSKINNTLTTTTMYAPITSQQFLSTVRKATLGIDTYKTLVNKLHDSNSNYDSLYLQIRALCTIYPQNCYQFTSILDTVNTNSKIYTTIWSSLIGAENDVGVNALSSILLNHANDWDWQKYIIGNLGGTNNCTDSMVLVLQQLYDATHVLAIKNTIELALASASDNLYNTNEKRSKLILYWLLQQLTKKVQNEKNITQEILVLGNINTKNAWQMLQQYAKLPNSEISKLAKQTILQIKNTIHN